MEPQEGFTGCTRHMRYEKRSRLKKRLPQGFKTLWLCPKSPMLPGPLILSVTGLSAEGSSAFLTSWMMPARLPWRRRYRCPLPAKRVIKVLEKIIWLNGKPKNIRCEQRPEFIAQAFKDWCEGNEINIIYIHPVNPLRTVTLNASTEVTGGLFLIDIFSATYPKSGN